ncbi:NAD-dependent epimerase/dehydratase family protein [Lapillicoccus sp.]|uniref:NAD-dependent epimerase/dehydratase family protein n=1 Tax=Lapillicoccus sp. TaxID=1909287 RepID=UPI0025D9894C|nr:NAD-dependent epimerase/dehydratase family protein [Lapillicoccus sp.]
MPAGHTAVVGASGFIGSALAARLQHLGEPASSFTRQSPPLRPDGRLAQGIADARAVVWAAASINPSIAESRPDLVEADLGALRTMLLALRAEGSRARVVMLSSGGTVYDPDEAPPFSEDSRCVPKGAYGRSKLAAEALVSSLADDAVVVRVANAYGPGQPVAPGQGVIAHWLQAIRDDLPVTVYGSLETARDYVHVDDIVSALLAVTDAAVPPPVVNIGSGTSTTLRDLLHLVESVVGPFATLHEQSRAFDVSRSWLDISLAGRTLSWQPAVDLRQGIASMWHADQVPHGD